MSLAKSAGRGAVWLVSGGGAQAVVRLGASMILARQLNPIDFGIFGIANMVYGLFELLASGGMTSGLIAKTDTDDDDLSTCFWSVMFIRSAIFLAIIFSAPFISYFLNNSRLTNILRAISFIIIFTGLGSVSRTIISKQLRFKSLVTINFIGSSLESALAVTLVLTTNLKYWSLIISMLFGIGIMNFLFIIHAKWLPSIKFNKNIFKYLFRYGINGMGSSIISYFSSNFDYLFITKSLGTNILGYYEFAYRIPHLINEKISVPAGYVVFPTLTKIKHDNTNIINGYLKSYKYIAWVTFPMLSGLILLAPSIVEILWGEKWAFIVTPMRILCISAAISTVTNLSSAIFLCKDRPDLPFKFDMITFFTTICSVLTLGHFYGLMGVAFAMVAAKATKLIATYYSFTIVKSSFMLYIRELSYPLSSSLIMSITVIISELILNHYHLNNTLTSIPLIIFGIITYTLTIKLIYKSQFQQILSETKHIFIRQ